MGSLAIPTGRRDRDKRAALAFPGRVAAVRRSGAISEVPSTELFRFFAVQI